MVRRYGDDLPVRYVQSGIWPHAQLVPDAPPSAHYGQALARNLEQAMRQLPINARTLAAAAGISHATVVRIRRGQTLPDLGTLARLTVVLGNDIFPCGLYTDLPRPPR